MALPPHKSRLSSIGPALVPKEQHQGKPAIRLLRPVYIVGSRSSARIHLISSSVSKAHAILVRSNNRSYIRDLASRTKIYINGREQRDADLEDGDLVKIGSFTFQYIAGSGEDMVDPEAMKIAPPAKLDVVGAEYPVPFEERVILVGRRTTCDIALVEGSVSTSHAAFFEVDGERYVRDLGSRTGTFVNGVSTHQHQLSPGDVVRIGETEMRYILNEVAPAVVVDEHEVGGEIPSLLEPVEHHEAPHAAPEPVEEIETPAVAEAPAEEESPIPIDEPLAPIGIEEPIEEAVEEAAIPVDEPLAVVEEETAAEVQAPESIDIAPASEPLLVEEEPLAVAPVDELAPEEPEPVAEIETPEPQPVEEPLAVAPVEELVSEEPETVAEIESPEPLAVEEPFEVAPIDELAPEEPEPVAEIESAEPLAVEEEPLSVADEEIAATPQEPESFEEEPQAPAEVADIVEEELTPAVADVSSEPVAPLSLASADEAESISERQDEYDINEPAGAAVLNLESTVAPEPLDELPLDIAPPIESEDAVEVVESTEPTPESALQESADELAMDALASPDVPLDEAVAASEGAQNLTDTSFDRAVREFAGDEIGEIVEPTPELEPEIAEVEAEPEAPAESVEAVSESAFEIPALEATPQIEEPPPLPELIEEESLPEATTDEPTEIELHSPGTVESVEPAAATAPGEVVPDLEFPPVDQEHKAPEPVAELLKIRPPPPARKPPPKIAVVPPEAKPSSDAPGFAEPAAPKAGARNPWGANQDNFLGGGVALNLADPFGGAAPKVPVPPIKKKGPMPPPPKSPLSDVPIGEKAVNDLIDEIDTVAAAAEQAAEAASTVPPISVSEIEQGAVEAVDSPRNEGNRPPREAFATGFDGLAMPPVREMDVFSQMSPPPLHPPSRDANAANQNDLADTLAGPSLESDNGEQPQVAQVGRKRSGIGGHSTFISRPEPDELLDDSEEAIDLRGTGSSGNDREATGQRRPLVAYPADELDEFGADDLRHQAIRRVAILIGTMVVLLALTGVGIYQFLGSNSTIEGSFTFKNLARQNMRERANTQSNQLQSVLSNDVTRRRAHDLLRPEVTKGFLDDTVEYNRVIQAAHFSDEKPDVLLIPVVSRDPESDKARVAAMLMALYEMNQGMVEQAARDRRGLDDLNKQIEAGQKKLAALNAEIQRLRLLGDSLPGAEQLKKLETENASLEKAWQEAANAVTQARAELEQLKTAPAAGAAAGGTARVGDDEKIKAMQAQLDDLQAKANAAKEASSEQFDNAKRQLDSALEMFEKQVADAQGMVNGSPEISTYLQDAQTLQERTRKLTTDLIRHQEQQFGSLMELKTRLNETMQQRRVEQWQKDAQLQELTERQAILTRQYNAAISSGLTKEASDKKVELDLTATMIKGRQDLVPADSFYAKAIEQLQSIIDNTKKNIDEDRRTTETQLRSLEEKFASSPALQKLPQEQKLIADNIQKHLAAVNMARQQYNKAIDTAGSGEVDTQLKSQISNIQAGIESRRKQLAEENLAQLKNSQTEQARLAAIEAKQNELNQRTEIAATAQKAFFDKNKELQDAQAKSQQAKTNAEELSRLIVQKPTDEQSLQMLVAQLENKTRTANDSIEPIKPVANNDISVALGNDRRLLYTLSSFGAILVVFVGLIFWTLHSASSGIPDASASDVAAELEGSPAQAPQGQNGDSKKGSDPDEDHEPAII